MNLSKVELSAVGGVVALGSYQMLSAYQSVAPSLGELREAPTADYTNRQKLMDADFLVGGLALMVGIAATLLARDYLPLVLVLGGFGLVSYWHHAVLNSTPPPTGS